MSAFEIVLIIVALVATALGSHGVGYGRGRRAGKTLDKQERSDIWHRGYRQGRADTIEDLEVEHVNATALPKKITQAMPLVPVSVDGDEPPYPPKLASDVRRPE